MRETDRTVCPIFKEEYVNPDGNLKLSGEDVLAGGWLNKIPKSLACPKCVK